MKDPFIASETLYHIKWDDGEESLVYLSMNGHRKRGRMGWKDQLTIIAAFDGPTGPDGKMGLGPVGGILGLREGFRDPDWMFVKSFEPVEFKDLPLYISWDVSPIFTRLLERFR